MQYQSSFSAICPGIESPPLPSTHLSPLLVNPASPAPTLLFLYRTVGARLPGPWKKTHPFPGHCFTQLFFLFKQEFIFSIQSHESPCQSPVLGTAAVYFTPGAAFHSPSSPCFDLKLLGCYPNCQVEEAKLEAVSFPLLPHPKSCS